jgi:hypothetical protein
VSHFEVGRILACGPRGYFINTIRQLSLRITVLSTCLTKPYHLCGARSIAKGAAKEGTIVPRVFRRAGANRVDPDCMDQRQSYRRLPPDSAGEESDHED